MKNYKLNLKDINPNLAKEVKRIKKSIAKFDKLEKERMKELAKGRLQPFIKLT
jgi:hypothetical protein|tara:strand:- start:746 stop:904 length:159 start_codon:yes stop_codon:yes gene_type:complete